MLIRARRILTRLLGDSRAQDMVEYALLAGFVAVASAATLPPIATDISLIFSKAQSVTDRAGGSSGSQDQGSPTQGS